MSVPWGPEASAGRAGSGMSVPRGPEVSAGMAEGAAPVPWGPPSVGVSSGGGEQVPSGPESRAPARARQRTLNQASTSSSFTGTCAPAAERTSSVRAPHTSPSPTFAPPGSSAPSRSPSRSTSLSSARAAPPFVGAGKAKPKRSGCSNAHHASAHQKEEKAWRKSRPGSPRTRSKRMRPSWLSASSAKSRTAMATPCLLPCRRYNVPTDTRAARANSSARTLS